MTDLSTASILAQIRALNDQAAAVGAPTPPPSGTDFAATLQDSLEQVSAMQHAANEQAVAFQRGDENASLVEVMLASQQAGLAFHAATEVRNKLVTAYQEIMNMPV
ncbi:MAG: flagellar hook-basal body complex protein FliE [Pseudomonadota bacterium]